MLDHPYLLRDDVELFADFDADLDQHGSIVGTNSLRLGQLMAHHLARQVRVEWLASALLARVRRNVDLRGCFFSDRRTCGGRRFGFVEEQILLLSPPRSGLGGKQLAQVCLQTFFEKADLNLQRTYLATQSVTLAAQRIPVSEERCVFFGGQGNCRHVRG